MIQPGNIHNIILTLQSLCCDQHFVCPQTVMHPFCILMMAQYLLSIMDS